MFEYDRLALDVAQQFTASAPPLNSSQQQHSQMDVYSRSPSLFSPKSESIVEEPSRRLSGGSTLSYNDFFDCGASSGYGSPGFVGTPLASPAPNSAQYMSHQLQKMFLDQGFYEGINQNNSQVSPKSSSTFMAPTKIHLGQLGTAPTNFASPPTLPNNFLSGITNEPLEETWGCFASEKIREEPKAVVSSARKSSCSSTTSDITTVPKETEVEPAVAVEDGFSPTEIAQFAQLLCSPKKAPPSRYQCHICYNTGHYISDCPLRFNSPYEELTPYQGRKKCYGEFQCQQCKRKWTSQNSVANEAQSCIKCHVPVFPHKQLPVDKAVALGLVKSQRVVPTKISPIGHGRPDSSAASIGAF